RKCCVSQNRGWRIEHRRWRKKIHHRSSILDLHSANHRAPLLRYMSFKLLTIFFNKCRRGHRRGVAKWTNCVTHNVAADVENQIEIVLVSLTLLNAVKDLFHPVTPFATRAALPAGLVGEKPGEVPRGANHTSGIVHHDDPARAKQASGGLDGF